MNIQFRVIYVSKAYIQNFVPLGPPFHCVPPLTEICGLVAEVTCSWGRVKKKKVFIFSASMEFKMKVSLAKTMR